MVWIMDVGHVMDVANCGRVKCSPCNTEYL